MPGYVIEFLWSPGGGAARQTFDAPDDDAARLKAALRFAAIDPDAQVVGYILRDAEGRGVFAFPQREG